MKAFLIKIIKKIFSIFLNLIVICFVFFIFTLILIVIVEKPLVKIKDNSILEIDLATHVTDSPIETSSSTYIRDMINPDRVATFTILQTINAIERAASDPRIVGILIKSESDSINFDGFALINEFRNALKVFKNTGKQVVAYFSTGDTRKLYLCANANAIILNPLGEFISTGITWEETFYSDAFKKYGIGVQITKSGKYKTAVESYTRSSMSEESKEQVTELVVHIWGAMLDEIAKERGLSVETLKQAINKTAIFLPDEAKNNRLVTDLDYIDKSLNYFNLKNASGNKIALKEKVSLKNYIREDQTNKSLEKYNKKPEVAVIYANGDIVSGEGYKEDIGSVHLRRKIYKVLENDEVKAVVLRVNSRGGSSLASEEIQRSLRVLKEKKPVIISMGSYAASGGYWISCFGNYIFADPLTITGSIGVYGLLFNIQEIASAHGITFDRVETTPYGGLLSFYKSKTPEELKFFQSLNDFNYQQFLEKVARGRNMPKDQVAQIAEGRAWLGGKAREIGLVDQLGGINDAILYAAKKANIESSYKLVQYPEPSDITFEFINFFSNDDNDEISTLSNSDPILKIVDRVKLDYAFLKSFNDPRGIYARFPYALHFQ